MALQNHDMWRISAIAVITHAQPVYRMPLQLVAGYGDTSRPRRRHGNTSTAQVCRSKRNCSWRCAANRSSLMASRCLFLLLLRLPLPLPPAVAASGCCCDCLLMSADAGVPGAAAAAAASATATAASVEPFCLPFACWVRTGGRLYGDTFRPRRRHGNTSTVCRCAEANGSRGCLPLQVLVVVAGHFFRCRWCLLSLPLLLPLLLVLPADAAVPSAAFAAAAAFAVATPCVEPCFICHLLAGCA